MVVLSLLLLSGWGCGHSSTSAIIMIIFKIYLIFYMFNSSRCSIIMNHLNISNNISSIGLLLDIVLLDVISDLSGSVYYLLLSKWVLL